jgi:hypothetical protein
MTLPDERFRSIFRTAEFLAELTDPKSTPGIPKKIRDEARWYLRHYPTYYDLKDLEQAAPHVVQEHMEPLYRMIKQHDQGKDNV